MATRQDAFERIAHEHSRSLLRVALRLTGSPAAAEDLVQEALLLAWRNFHQIREEDHARPWLFRILFNRFYSLRRKKSATYESVALESIPSSAEPRTAIQSGEPVDMARALDSLAEEHRTVLMLGVVEGFTCQQISEMLAVPIGTVMSRLSRARAALKAKLAPAAQCAEKGAR